MPGFVYVDPANTKNRYYTKSTTDPGIPAGYVLQSGSDGSDDRAFQTFKPGAYSGGFPSYGNKANDRGTFGDQPGQLR